MLTLDPWLTRRSATCPLCKYECKIQSSEVEESSDGESTTESRTSLPNDRLMVFIMGPDWVAARTHHHHNGTSWIDRIGDFFGRMSDRIRGRPLRPSTPPLQSSAATSVSRVDGNSELSLQLITGARPPMTSRSTGGSSVHPDASVLVPIPPLVHVNPSSRSQNNIPL